MQKVLTWKYSLDTFLALAAIAGFVLMLSEFLIGKHFIRPTLVLVVVVFFGNVARHGFRDALWAKYLAFWVGVILSAHWFFALFYAKTLRGILESGFVPVVLSVFLMQSLLTFRYYRANSLRL